MTPETVAETVGVEPDDPIVREIFDELSVIARERDRDPARLLVAILQLAISACKSFGASPDEFVENFRLFYDNSKEREVQ